MSLWHFRKPTKRQTVASETCASPVRRTSDFQPTSSHRRCMRSSLYVSRCSPSRWQKISVPLSTVTLQSNSPQSVTLQGSGFSGVGPLKIRIGDVWLAGIDRTLGNIAEFNGSQINCTLTCVATVGCIGSVYSSSLNHCWIKSSSARRQSSNADRTLVYIAGIQVTDVVVIDDSHVKFTMPVWGGQSIMLTVYAANNITNTDSQPLYSFPAPIITSVTPDYIPSNGSLSTITGQNLLSGRTTVSAGGYSCSVQSVSSSQIECLWSAGQGGPYSVSVNVQGLTATSLNVSFMVGPNYVASPTNITDVLSLIRNDEMDWTSISLYLTVDAPTQPYPSIFIQAQPGTKVSFSAAGLYHHPYVIQSSTPLEVIGNETILDTNQVTYLLNIFKNVTIIAPSVTLRTFYVSGAHNSFYLQIIADELSLDQVHWMGSAYTIANSPMFVFSVRQLIVYNCTISSIGPPYAMYSPSTSDVRVEIASSSITNLGPGDTQFTFPSNASIDIHDNNFSSISRIITSYSTDINIYNNNFSNARDIRSEPILSLCGGAVYNNTFTTMTNVVTNTAGKLYLTSNVYTSIVITAVTVSGGELVAYNESYNVVTGCVRGSRFISDLSRYAFLVTDSILRVSESFFNASSINDIAAGNSSVFVYRCTMIGAGSQSISIARYTSLIVSQSNFTSTPLAIKSRGNCAVYNCTFSNNGQGIEVSGGNLLDQGNIFTDHSTGAITAYTGATSLTSISSTFVRNTNRDGGAIYATSLTNLLSVSNGTFIDNVASTKGGSISISGTIASVIIQNCSFNGDSAGKDGGSIDLTSTFVQSVLLRDLSIYNGSVGGSGGAMHMSGSMGSVTVENVRGGNMVATQGGFLVISLSDGHVKVDNIMISGCSALIGGSNESDIYMTDVIIYNNSASVRLSLICELTESDDRGRMDNNSCVFQGGGIVTASSSRQNVLVIESKMRWNTAQTGAGVCILGLVRDVIKIRNSDISYHESLRGSAIYVDKAVCTVEVYNSIFIGNTATTNGGAVCLQGKGHSLITFNTTWSNNLAVNGAGLYLSGTWSSVDLMSLDSHANNATFGASVYISSGVTGDINISNCTMSDNSAIQGSALYVNLQGVSGSTFSRNRATVSAAVLYTTSSTNESSVTLSDTKMTANTAPDGAVYRADGQYTSFEMRDLYVRSSRSVISSAIALYATSESISINGGRYEDNQGREGAVFQHPTFYYTNKLTVSNAIFVGNSISGGGQGGAISISGSSSIIDIINNTFVYNSAKSGGGAVYVQGTSSSARLQIEGGTFSECYTTSNDGGAVLVQGPLESVTMRGVSFSSCRAATGSGGTMMYSGVVGSVDVDSCTFYNNSAATGGSLKLTTISLQKRSNFSHISLSSSSFYSNQASQGGGAVYVQNGGDVGSIVMDNNTFGNNTSLYGDSVYVVGGATMSDDVVKNGIVYVGPSTRVNVTSGSYPANAFVLSSSDSVVEVSMMDYNTASSLLVCPSGQKTGNTTDGSIGCLISTSNTINDSASKDLSVGLIAGIVIGSCAVLVVVIFIIVLLLQRNRKRPVMQSMELVDLSRLNLEPAKKSIINFNDIKNMQVVGHGAFGIVYSAIWRESKVAVKQIRSDYITTEQLKDFLGEVSILQNLRPHNNVVLFLGVSFPPQPLAIITEFCDGGSLYTYLQENTVEFAKKKEMMIGVAAGMIHLHAEGVIHRDLAVRNILLTKSMQPKVSDFGLSRESSDGSDGGKTQSSIGPVKWMAPESIASRVYSSKSDVWSYGVLCWEICTTQDPWAERQPMEVATAVMNGETLHIPQQADDVVAYMLGQCWQKQPDDRPSFSDIYRWLKDKVWDESEAERQMQRTQKRRSTERMKSTTKPVEPNYDAFTSPPDKSPNTYSPLV
ncbi:hypothetical protein PROFUN_02314 [Planoprotostelium fungivorum]|uniref:receptor protein-tyrosine kinase n=1 Tax=Planoprotostelium fungivorum TaxID=1890364 RepID=A0A2P6NYK3_9EUKA|nr:hypothetical protein PROFUN_02314 [Planoprotostelium fungivorum]